MADQVFDVDEYRLEHESSAEWNLRKPFLLAHHDKFDETRLVCLSSCFINVEMYGCSYPPGVMEQLRFLKDEIQDEVDEFQKKVKDRTSVKFVKATDKDQPKRKGMASTDPGGGACTANPDTKNKLLKPLAFVKSSDSLGATPSVKFGVVLPSTAESSTESSRGQISLKSLGKALKPSMNAEQLKRDVVLKPQTMVSPTEVSLKKLGNQLNLLENTNANSISVLHMACQKCQLKIDSVFDFAQAGQFCCEVLIDSVVVAKGTGQNKKLAKQTAFSEAVEILTNCSFEVVSVNGRKEIVRADEKQKTQNPHTVLSTSALIQNQFSNSVKNLTPAGRPFVQPRKTGRKRPLEQQKSIADMILIEHFTCMLNTNAMNILKQSADFNKIPLSYNFREARVGERCDLELMGHILADVTCEGRANAKLKVAARALEKLRRSNWTILVKQAADTSDEGLSKTEVVGDGGKAAASAIPDSNIGSKLLKMMGWRGGGIGAEGNKGIEEPVTAAGIVNREGLGLEAEKGFSKDFLPKIKQVINDFLRSDREDDLAFAPDFTKEERAAIHKEAQRLGLKSHSHGAGENRFLVLSRKRNAAELFDRVMREGGETSKYKLIAPGQHPGLQRGGEGKQWVMDDCDEDGTIAGTAESRDATGKKEEGAAWDIWHW